MLDDQDPKMLHMAVEMIKYTIQKADELVSESLRLYNYPENTTEQELLDNTHPNHVFEERAAFYFILSSKQDLHAFGHLLLEAAKNFNPTFSSIYEKFNDIGQKLKKSCDLMKDVQKAKATEQRLISRFMESLDMCKDDDSIPKPPTKTVTIH